MLCQNHNLFVKNVPMFKLKSSSRQLFKAFSALLCYTFYDIV